MSEIYLSADWHCGEPRMSIMQRPFKDADEQFEVLKANHNAIVEPDDLVLMLGDVCNKEHPECLPQASELNGRKWLFRGNHDRGILDDDFKTCFERIFQESEVILTQFEGIPCALNHYPSLGQIEFFNIFGHIHSAFKFALNGFNCGVDVNHFRPVNVKQIPFFLTAISEYYDNDVWSFAYPFNMRWYNKRGKKGTYFTGETILRQENIQ